MTMQLRFLDFEYSEDDAGHGVFDAMAAVWPEQLTALQAELVAVLGWAHAEFGEPGPIGEAAEWDVDLGSAIETTERQALVFDPATQRMVTTPGTPAKPRHTISISIGGTSVFCRTLRERFGLDAL